MAKRKSSKKTVKLKQSKTVYDNKESSYDNELSEILSSNKEKIFTFGGITGIIIVLLIIFFGGSQFKQEAIIEDDILADEQGEIISVEETIQNNDFNESLNLNKLNEDNSLELDDKDVINSNVDLEQDLTQKPIEPKSEFIESFTLRPTCNKGYHVYEIYTKFLQLPLTIIYQIRTKGESEFKDVLEIKGEFEKYTYLYVCDGCPVDNDISILENKDYEIRLKINLFGEISYSEIQDFSTKPDSEIMEKVCDSTKVCDDTEYEKNPRTRGLIKFNGEEYIEFCDSETSTEEYWCEDGEVKKEIIECEIKCFLGHCVG